MSKHSAEGKHAAPAPVDCPNHDPVQHRDGKPRWCNGCGLTEDYQTPTGRL